jgi:hypothetical protein
MAIEREELWKKIKSDRKCHGGHLHPTLNPNELKCNYGGWTRTLIKND